MGIPLARLRCVLVVLTPLAILAPRRGAAQTPLSLSPGAHVRVRAASLGPATRTGRVVTADADTLIMRPDGSGGVTVTLPRAEITQLDVSLGRRTRKGRFALMGFGLGAVAGWFVGAASYSDPCKTEPAICSGFFYETRGSDAFGGAVAGGLLGAIGGAITGQLWTTERWTPHPLLPKRTGLRILPARRRRQSVEIALTMPLL